MPTWMFWWDQCVPSGIKRYENILIQSNNLITWAAPLLIYVTSLLTCTDIWKQLYRPSGMGWSLSTVKLGTYSIRTIVARWHFVKAISQAGLALRSETMGSKTEDFNKLFIVIDPLIPCLSNFLGSNDLFKGSMKRRSARTVTLLTSKMSMLTPSAFADTGQCSVAIHTIGCFKYRHQNSQSAESEQALQTKCRSELNIAQLKLITTVKGVCARLKAPLYCE